jgi:hypothetical protein
LSSYSLLRQTPPPILVPEWSRQRKADSVKAKLLLSATIVVGMLHAVALAQSSDPLIGTWKLNPEKSTGAKSGSTTIEAAGNGIKFTVDLVASDGTASHWGFTANFDGKDYPVTGEGPYGNAVMLTRVDARTIKITSKQDGKVTTTSTITVSEDGKTRTSDTKGTDAKGKPIDVKSLYEKQ